nr:chromosome transmission fidelity protein 8 homolog [Equus caballus]
MVPGFWDYNRVPPRDPGRPRSGKTGGPAPLNVAQFCTLLPPPRDHRLPSADAGGPNLAPAAQLTPAPGTRAYYVTSGFSPLPPTHARAGTSPRRPPGGVVRPAGAGPGPSLRWLAGAGSAAAGLGLGQGSAWGRSPERFRPGGERGGEPALRNASPSLQTLLQFPALTLGGNVGFLSPLCNPPSAVQPQPRSRSPAPFMPRLPSLSQMDRSASLSGSRSHLSKEPAALGLQENLPFRDLIAVLTLLHKAQHYSQ